MKEYWVNVYKDDYIMGAYYSRESAVDFGDQLGGGIGYRLHVREFDTKEAKELYLAYKYNRPRTGSMIVKHREMVMKGDWLS